MNEGFKKYYKIGLKSTHFAYKNYKNLLNYYAFLIMEVIACIAIIPIPMMILAKVKMAKKVRYEQTIRSFNLFSIKNKNGFKQLWLTILLLILHYLSRVILILLAGGFCFLIGMTISYYINQGGSSNTKELISLIILIIMTLPATIVYGLYTIYFVLSIKPIAFIIASSEKMTITQVIHCSFQATKNAKGTLFLISFVDSLIYLGTIGVVAGGIFVCTTYLNNLYLQIIICFLLSLIGFYIITRFKMSNSAAKYSLYEDLVRNTATEKIVNHIKFSRSKGNYQNAEKNQLQLFDKLSSFDGGQPQQQETKFTETPVSKQDGTSIKNLDEQTQKAFILTEKMEEEPQEELIPAEEIEEEPQEELSPVQEIEEEPQEEPIPAEEIEEEPQEELSPTEEIVETPVSKQDKTSVEVQEEISEVQEEAPKPKRGRKPKTVKTEETSSSVEVQEEAPKPKRGRKPKAVEVNEAPSDTSKKAIRKTSTRTKKSEAENKDSSDTSTSDSKGEK